MGGVRQQPPRFLHLKVLITRKKTALEQALAVFISSAKICDFRKRCGCCRDDWIRTSDHTHPMRVRYQTAPHPVK